MFCPTGFPETAYSGSVLAHSRVYWRKRKIFFSGQSELIQHVKMCQNRIGIGKMLTAADRFRGPLVTRMASRQLSVLSYILSGSFHWFWTSRIFAPRKVFRLLVKLSCNTCDGTFTRNLAIPVQYRGFITWSLTKGLLTLTCKWYIALTDIDFDRHRSTSWLEMRRS